MKQPYIFAQVIRDDLDFRPDRQRPATAHLPARQLSQRQTWPTSPRERRPGSFFFQDAPTLTRTPWEIDRKKRRPQSQWSRHTTKPRSLPARVFEQLPHEIYSCIVDHLEAICRNTSVADISPLQQELSSLCLVSRRWAKVAIEHLYRELWLPPNVPESKRKLSVSRPKSRLELLSRTLSDAPGLASLVRRIHVNSLLSSELYGKTSRDGLHRELTRKLLRDVVSFCSELEAVSGYSPPLGYDKDYQLALLQCSRLSSHVWLTNGFALNQRFDPGQFLDLHNNWQWLETLVLYSQNQWLLGAGMISGITSRLWSLKHLMVYGFSQKDFHNGTLLSLPPLKSLRLECLAGVTDQGIEQLAGSRIAFSLQRLSLVSLDLLSLRTIQALLSQLPCLERLRLVQDTCPSLLVGADYMHKRSELASPSLRYLHWDTLVPGPVTAALAHSIKQGSFPALRTIKAPSDHDGDLQTLCRPIVQRTITPEDARFLKESDTNEHYTRSLRLSQLQAQLRVRETKQQPSFNLVVEDAEEHVQHTHVIGKYLGDMHSVIEYSLEPDVEWTGNLLVAYADVLRSDFRNTLGGEQSLSLRVLF